MTLQTIFRPGLFDDKVAIVTGGGTGIGLAIAEELVQLGARVVIASRKMKRLAPAAKGLSRDYDAQVIPLTCNIRDRESVAALYDQTLGAFGKIDFLINNGGGQFMAAAESISEKGWKAVIDTNLNGTWNMCQVGGEKWFYDHGGRIVNVIADMWRGFPGMVHTGASRAGIANLTMTLAAEWAKFGIQINCVAPGVILSTGAHNYPPGMMEALDTHIPLKRLGSPEEVSSAVMFLLGPGGDFITGESLRIDGGSSLWGNSWPIPDPDEKPQYTIPPWPEDRWPEFALTDEDE
jgi:NAD(P)-dependent dehydrogenase (short-subunit alcohol dehydrogenase family)